MPRTLTKLLAAYPPDVRDLALGMRDRILESIPGAEENVDSSSPVVGYGYGAGYKGLICTLIVSKSGVKLGLVRGAELNDPRGLLEGRGKIHRYVSLRTAADVASPGVKQLVKQAYLAWKARQ